MTIKNNIFSQLKNLHRVVKEKQFYYWISIKLGCDEHHNLLKKKILPIYVAKHIKAITCMFSR